MAQVNPKDFELNRDNLAQSVMRQSSLYDYYGGLVAETERKIAQLKNQLEIQTADARIKIKADADANKLKLTVDDINARIISMAGIQELKSQIIDAEYDYNALNTAVKALEHKRDMIKTMTSLTLSKSYNLSDALDDQARQQVNEQAVNQAYYKKVFGDSL